MLSQFKGTYMLIMDHPTIIGEDLPEYTKEATWHLFHAYIDTLSQILIGEYTGDGVQAISRLQSQCENMTFSDQSSYNRPFKQVIHKGGESEINYIKIFQNSKALAISVGNSYSEYQLMHTLFENFQQVRR